jgi:hypothetical protein
MKNIEIVKKLIQEGSIQEALEKFSDIVFESDSVEVTNVFMNKYQTGESIYQLYGNDLNDSCVDIESDGTIYEVYEKEDESIMVINVTKESLINVVKNFEKLLNVA